MLSVPPLLVFFRPFTPVPRDGYPLSASPLLFPLPTAFLSHLEFSATKYSFCFQTLAGATAALDFALGRSDGCRALRLQGCGFFRFLQKPPILLSYSLCHSPTSLDSVYTVPAKLLPPRKAIHETRRHCHFLLAFVRRGNRSWSQRPNEYLVTSRPTLRRQPIRPHCSSHRSLLRQDRLHCWC